MSGKLSVICGLRELGVSVIWINRYERRETEVATAAWTLVYENYTLFYTFSWTTACSPNRITLPGAETKKEFMVRDRGILKIS